MSFENIMILALIVIAETAILVHLYRRMMRRSRLERMYQTMLAAMRRDLMQPSIGRPYHLERAF